MLFSPKVLYQSSKKFVLYDYLVSHGQLLLRADKINEPKDFNTDIIFLAVEYMQLPAYFLNGISIILGNDKKRFGYQRIDESLARKHKCFEILDDSGSYYIVASSFQVFENDLAFGQTSLGVFDPKGREKEIARSF